MATVITSGQKVVLVFDKGSYGFDRIKTNATRDKIFELAGALNAFQADRPPLKVLHKTTKQVIN